MDEMDKYRERVERRYHNRRKRERYVEGGRRKVDYKSPPMFYWSDLWLLIPMVLGAALVLFMSGCALIKKTFRGD